MSPLSWLKKFKVRAGSCQRLHRIAAINRNSAKDGTADRAVQIRSPCASHQCFAVTKNKFYEQVKFDIVQRDASRYFEARSVQRF